MQVLLALVSFALSVARAGAVPAPRQLSGLNDLFVAKGKLFWGNIGDSNTLSISSNTEVLTSEFGALTPENSMKWESIEPTQGSFSFTGADALVDFANSNCLMVRGHTLVWHSQLPAYVSAISDAATLTSVIQSHIAGVAGRYAGQFYAWDVVNEVLNEDGTLRSSVFSNVLGDSFIATAFEAARAADSTAKLYINDFNLDSNNAKVQAMVALVKKVNSGTQLIDGIGTQTHLSAGGSSGVADAITTLASTGLEVAITELDIASAPTADYVAVAQACLDEPSETPLLFDSSFAPKDAYDALVSLLL